MITFYFWIVQPECTGVSEEFLLNKVNDKSTFHGDICGPISATIHEAMFSLVITKWRYAFESLKETNDYKFLSSSGSVMKSMVSNFVTFLIFFKFIIQ